jgi:hypothetical protein
METSGTANALRKDGVDKPDRDVFLVQSKGDCYNKSVALLLGVGP